MYMKNLKIFECVINKYLSSLPKPLGKKEQQDQVISRTIHEAI